MNKLIRFNIWSLCIILLLNLILSFLPSGKNCIFLSDNGCINGLGKVDVLNRKQGNWIFRNPEDGRINLIGNFLNNKKNGEWFIFYDEPYNKISDYYIFKDDSIDGAVKSLSMSGDVVETFYFKNGEYYFYKDDFRNNSCIDGDDVDELFKELQLLDVLYKEESSNIFDDEWNHKKLGHHKQLPSIYNKAPFRMFSHDWSNKAGNISRELIPDSDTKIYINQWTNLSEILNYTLLVIVLVINYLGYRRIKNESK